MKEKSNLQGEIIPFQYDRSKIKNGIIHIGVGNFHRAHQAFYTNDLLADTNQNAWGICGVMLLPGDEKLYHALKKQDNIYTLTVCGGDDKDEVYSIGSITELIWAIENPDAVIEKIADANTKIISLTITEGGYNIDKQSGKFMLDNENIEHDLKNPTHPKTVFGYIAEGLRARRKAGNGGLTILSCDNLQHNGNTTERAVKSFVQAQDMELASWISENVTFPNSMVDRITPVTTPLDVERLNHQNGTADLVPVYCEDFIQWVIEDNFVAGRPDWEQVGVEFTDDVTAFENMKLSLLNASHTLLAYPAFLSGYRKVDVAMQDENFVRLLQNFMDIDITPYVPAPGSIDLSVYKKTLIERFANKSVSDQLSRLCFDGISKFPVYIMPNLAKMLRDGKDLTRVAFLIAAYRHYLKYKTDDNRITYEVAEPWLTENDKRLIASDESIDFLSLSAFESVDLSNSATFKVLYRKYVSEILKNGIIPVLKSILV
ncbi:MAG: mannitol dehydrogenase family protein [Dysgonomonas sp.]